MKNPSYRSLARGVSWLLSILCAAVISAFASNVARAQGSAQDEVKTGPTAVDHAAAAEASVVYRHARPANTPAGSALKHKDVTARIASSAAPTGTATPEDNDQIRFPADLTYNGGPVVTAAESHAIYLLPHGKCPIATCWGNPEGFLRDLEISEFAHITDQYVHTGANNRYAVGKHTMISYTPTPKTAPLTDLDMQAVVHAVASLSGQTGYGHIYHVFLPPGQDECFTATDHICYSPDVPATFIFCAYHSSVDFKDIGHVLYSVEPFQNVGGCSVRPGTPNGQLVDSTNNVLSHEIIETITDPDGTAWFNILDNGLFGQEIGDECSFLVFVPISPTVSVPFFDPTVFTLGQHRYAIQPEYSNDAHACATSF
jgi:hypothetical protein